MGIHVLPALVTIRKRHRCQAEGIIRAEGDIDHAYWYYPVRMSGLVQGKGEIARLWSEWLLLQGEAITGGAIAELIPSFVRAYGLTRIQGNIEELIPSFVRMNGIIRANPNVYPYLRWEKEDISAQNGGTQEVATAEDLYNVRNNLGGSYIQTADIDLSGYDPWIPIGRMGWPLGTDEFSGTYNGNGYKITGMTCDAADELGLFGGCVDATLINITIEGASITGTGMRCAILCGQYWEETTNAALIRNCHVSGTVETTHSAAGGLIGQLDLKASESEAAVQFCTADVTVQGNWSIGGLIGDIYTGAGAKMYKCSAAGDITGVHRVGGLLGEHYRCTVEQCSATGDSTATGSGRSAGGFAGRFRDGSLRDSYAHGTPSGDVQGGLIGDLEGTAAIERCYALGPLFGAEGANTTVSDCYYDAEASGMEGDRGRTTSEMKTKATFDNWDFEEVWDNQSGFVILE